MKIASDNTVVRTLFPSDCALGEGPMWHAKRNSCFWVDIDRCRLYEYDWKSGQTRLYDIKRKVSLVILGSDDLILGLQGGVFRYNLETQVLSMITDLGENWSKYRCNDGIADSRGRLLVGTMELNHLSNASSVYSVDSYGISKKLIEGATIPNGMAWSIDGKKLYYIDSPNQCVNSYLYEQETGSIHFEQTVVTIPDHMGVPDGMTIDQDGMLWIALWGGFGVGCFDLQSGALVKFIDIPAPFVTSCVFAGENLDHLIVTTAIAHMTPDELIAFPRSGQTFVAKPGIKGIADHICIL